MTNTPAINAVAVIGLVLLADNKTVIDLGTVAKIEVLHEEGDAVNGIELRLHGQSNPMRLSGDDALGIWTIMSQAATPTKSLIPQSIDVPLTPTDAGPGGSTSTGDNSPQPPLGGPVADSTSAPSPGGAQGSVSDSPPVVISSTPTTSPPAADTPKSATSGVTSSASSSAGGVPNPLDGAGGVTTTGGSPSAPAGITTAPASAPSDGPTSASTSGAAETTAYPAGSVPSGSSVPSAMPFTSEVNPTSTADSASSAPSVAPVDGPSDNSTIRPPLSP